jgi:hypothetical protein
MAIVRRALSMPASRSEHYFDQQVQEPPSPVSPPLDLDLRPDPLPSGKNLRKISVAILGVAVICMTTYFAKIATAHAALVGVEAFVLGRLLGRV